MVAKALVFGLMGTAAIFALLAIMAVLPIIIIFLIITGVSYVVIQERAQEQHQHKLPRGPP